MAEFTEKEPKKNLLPFGKSGTLVLGFEVVEDYLQEFIGIRGQELCNQILISDSTVRKLFNAVSNPIRSAVWDIQPASDSEQDLKIANLIKHILFHDICFSDTLDEILLFPWHGHSVFEVVHQNVISRKFGPYTGLKALAFRDQRTLDRWHFNEAGILEKVHQIQNGDILVDVDIPAENLLIFYNEKKGSSNGFPFCRMIYGNYKRKLLYKQLQAIGIERAAIPVPHLELPDGIAYDSDEYKSAVTQLENFTLAEQAYFITPMGYKLNYNPTGTFNPANVQVAIKAENEEIAGSLVAMFLEMGIGGNAAVGSSTTEAIAFFKSGIEYIADKIKNVINRELIPNLVRLNFLNVDEYPQLIHAGISDDVGKSLMEIVTGYTNAKVITPDELLEDHIRKVHNLPKKAAGEMVENEESEDEIESNPEPTPEPEKENLEVLESDEVELSDKSKPVMPKKIIDTQSEKIANEIKKAIEFASAKYINDTMVRFKQLPVTKKQKATDKIKIGGIANFRKDLKRALTETVSIAIAEARKEVPTKKEVQLNNNERDMLRMVEMFGDISDIKLNEFSKLPAYIQVLVQKQTDLISEDVLNELKSRLDFSFSSMETKSDSAEFIKQSMIDESDKFLTSNVVSVKGTNAASLMVNEGREAFFFEPDVLEEIHSFTFMNEDPKAPICRELAGTTFETTDMESLRYTPPLHHNCKSYLRANLKSSRNVDKLTVSTLSPSAEAEKSITL